MAGFLKPWIHPTLSAVLSDPQCDLSDPAVTSKHRLPRKPRAQIVSILANKPTAHGLLGTINDSKHTINAVFTHDSVAGVQNDSQCHVEPSDFQGGMVIISKYWLQPLFKTQDVIVVVQEFDFVGSEGCSTVGDPRQCSEDPDTSSLIRRWLSLLQPSPATVLDPQQPRLEKVTETRSLTPSPSRKGQTQDSQTDLLMQLLFDSLAESQAPVPAAKPHLPHDGCRSEPSTTLASQSKAPPRGHASSAHLATRQLNHQADTLDVEDCIIPDTQRGDDDIASSQGEATSSRLKTLNDPPATPCEIPPHTSTDAFRTWTELTNDDTEDYNDEDNDAEMTDVANHCAPVAQAESPQAVVRRLRQETFGQNRRTDRLNRLALAYWQADFLDFSDL